jgi:hypothetical protein
MFDGLVDPHNLKLKNKGLIGKCKGKHAPGKKIQTGVCD